MKYKYVALKGGKSLRGPVPRQYQGDVIHAIDAAKDNVTIEDVGNDILVSAQATGDWMLFPNSDVEYKVPIEVTREKGSVK